MDLRHIKIGETYYVRVKVTEKIDDKIITRTVSDKGSFLIESHTIFFDDEVLAFSHVPPPTPIKFFKMTAIPEVYPKYDPNRKFRSGDKVRSKQVNGRWYSGSDKEHAGQLLTVKEDEGTEDTASVVYVAPNDKTNWMTDPAYLELVTPVEELEPYYVKEIIETVQIRRDGCGSFVASYDKESHPNAKAAAEAECDRLNEEYRKEQEQ